MLQLVPGVLDMSHDTPTTNSLSCGDVWHARQSRPFGSRALP